MNAEGAEEQRSWPGHYIHQDPVRKPKLLFGLYGTPEGMPLHFSRFIVSRKSLEEAYKPKIPRLALPSLCSGRASLGMTIHNESIAARLKAVPLRNPYMNGL